MAKNSGYGESIELPPLFRQVCLRSLLGPVAEFPDVADDLVGRGLNRMIPALECVGGKAGRRLNNAGDFFQGFVDKPGAGRAPHAFQAEGDFQELVLPGRRGCIGCVSGGRRFLRTAAVGGFRSSLGFGDDPHPPAFPEELGFLKRDGIGVIRCILGLHQHPENLFASLAAEDHGLPRHLGPDRAQSQGKSAKIACVSDARHLSVSRQRTPRDLM